jgi:hypothetical protein
MDISRVFPSDLETLADARLGDLHLTKLHSLSIISSVQMREICNITTLRKLTVHVTSDAGSLVLHFSSHRAVALC